MKRLRFSERPDWREQADALGFRFHSPGGSAYWDDGTCYQFTLAQIEHGIEESTRELHAMCLDLVDAVIDSEQAMDQLAIPEPFRDWIRRSWQRRDPHVYGRMDLAFDGNGAAKLYELNADTPTSLYESAYFQWLWLEQRIASRDLPADADQFNRIQEALCERFARLAREQRLASTVHFAADAGSAEDVGTIEYLRDCAHQAGIATEPIALDAIGLSEDGWFTDADDRVIGTLFKLYPLEWMMRDAFGMALLEDRVQLIEPPWKALLSNKGILPLLWERHPGHPNLLPARFDDGRGAVPRGWVRKPLHSREGANIDMAALDGRRWQSPGPYGEGPTILQAFHPLPEFARRHPLVGSWVIGDEAAGIGLREDATLITRDTSCFVPHVILR